MGWNEQISSAGGPLLGVGLFAYPPSKIFHLFSRSKHLSTFLNNVMSDILIDRIMDSNHPSMYRP